MAKKTEAQPSAKSETASPAPDLRGEIANYAAAGYPCLAVETVEEERLVTSLLGLKLGSAGTKPTSAFRIAAVGGLKNLHVEPGREPVVSDANATYQKAFEVACKRNTLLVVFDFQHLCRNPGAYRSLRDSLPRVKAAGSYIVLVAPHWQLPEELTHEVPVVHWALPSRPELRAALQVCAEAAPDETYFAEDANSEEACLDAAAGLTLSEAEGAFAISIVTTETFSRARIEQEKMRLIRNTGFLEVAAPESPDSIGGLGQLKDYLSQEVVPARHDPELQVRGILLVGVPGTGKSLAAKATGALLHWPVVRLDIGACKGSLVGQSESNLRSALKLVDAISPCVLWLDELEKAVGGYASSAVTDSGVTLGMLGALLTWMQEHKTQVLVVATCNDYAKLPAELTRAGRFDERFFVDLPTDEERLDIAAVHLARYGAPTSFAAQIASSDLTAGWTGAEIEQLVRSASRRTARNLTAEAVDISAKEIKPISVVRANEINALRGWANTTLRLANSVITTTNIPIAPSRNIRTAGGIQ